MTTTTTSEFTTQMAATSSPKRTRKRTPEGERGEKYRKQWAGLRTRLLTHGFNPQKVWQWGLRLEYWTDTGLRREGTLHASINPWNRSVQPGWFIGQWYRLRQLLGEISQSELDVLTVLAAKQPN